VPAPRANGELSRESLRHPRFLKRFAMASSRPSRLDRADGGSNVLYHRPEIIPAESTRSLHRGDLRGSLASRCFSGLRAGGAGLDLSGLNRDDRRGRGRRDRGGFLLAYRAGWDVSVGSLAVSAAVALLLVLSGRDVREQPPRPTRPGSFCRDRARPDDAREAAASEALDDPAAGRAQPVGPETCGVGQRDVSVIAPVRRSGRARAREGPPDRPGDSATNVPRGRNGPRRRR
jgi:hypothetical protein